MDEANEFGLSPQVDSDLSCRNCGYNLRGLKCDGHCPECGGWIAFTVRGDALYYSDAEWLDAVGQSIKTMQILLWLPLTLVPLLPVGGLSFYFAIVLLAFYLGEGWRISRAESSVSREAEGEC